MLLILLAAGFSTRFNSTTPKQLYEINGKSVIELALEPFINKVSHVIIVCNSLTKPIIKQVVRERIKEKNNKFIYFVSNNKNSRLKSIEVGLRYARKNLSKVSNLIIHDVARPYITPSLVESLLEEIKTTNYVQYCLPLYNGLAKKVDDKYCFLDRSEYIEVVTPLCCKYELFCFIFLFYIMQKESQFTEVISVLNILDIDYKMIESKYCFLKKITFIEDIVP